MRPNAEFSKAVARVQQLRTLALFAVHDANRAFVERGWADPIYVAGRTAMDPIMIKLAQAKWLFGRVDGTGLAFAAPADHPQDMLETAERGFLQVAAECKAVRIACERGERPVVDASRRSPTRSAEILFAGDTPLVPTVSPVVVLQGSQRDMGRQYAQQVIEIYGTWIFERQAAAQLTAPQLEEVQRWAEELARHTPGILDFAAGMAEGATRSGVPLSYDQAVCLWTGSRPPAKEARPMAFAQNDGHDARITAAYLGVPVTSETDLCSGICAWGAGTKDGSLVAGSSTDHDCTFQATIVAFPDSGHAHIYTPFSANGAIPVLGDFHMGGHPGMNDQGLAYVHHGGANTGEPVEQWGYGVRRGPATFHILQNCSTAVEAREAHKRFPVGDSGISLGTVGGMFADARYGFSMEARAGAPAEWKPILREHSYDVYGTAFDFLYANNNAMDPASAHLNVPPPEGYRYTVAGGWFTRSWEQINAEPGPKAFRRLNTRNSEGRNRYAYRMMMEGYGRVDIDYMTMVYRQSGEMPPGTLDEIQRLWQSDTPWNSSTAHRANAFTAIMNPRAGEDGAYFGCVGPANRAVQPRGPEHGYYYFDETNAFSELRLRKSPTAVLQAGISTAADDIQQARQLSAGIGKGHAGAAQFSAWLDEAESQLRNATTLAAERAPQDHDAALAQISRALRCATRAQVRARQVAEAIAPPPTRGAHLRGSRG